MKSSAKRYVLLGALGYVALLSVLTLSERLSPDSSINSLADAVWYSIVTLSTVGYGDMYPVTWPGRLVGIIFALMSLGVLSLVVGAAVRFFTGMMLPKFKLHLLRRHHWYLFSEANDSSLALAKELADRNPDSLCLFPLEQQNEVPDIAQFRFYPETLELAAAAKAEDCSLFFMNSDGSNYNRALGALALGHPIYCRTQQVPKSTVPGLTLFNRYACCAQEYWRTHPLGSKEDTIVLIGDGAYARHLLEQGLLVNVFPGRRRITYHVFGDWADFRRNHSCLDSTLSVDSSQLDIDCLHFHTEPWNMDGDLLYEAARVIICQDDDDENLNLLTLVRQYFPLQGKLHIRSLQTIPGERIFGTNEQIYTADAVIGDRLTKIARMMHQIYVDGSDGTAQPWEELSPFLHQSNIAAADHLLTKVRCLLADDRILTLTPENCAAAYDIYLSTREESKDLYREAEHRRWMRFHSLYNWQYAPVRDNAARLHPLMKPYEDLPSEQQAKDDYAWELIGKIGKRL